MKGKTILTLNCGSSSIRFALFNADESLKKILKGKIEGVGTAQANFAVQDVQGEKSFSRAQVIPDHAAAVTLLTDWIQTQANLPALVAIGHRVVHGGQKYYVPQRITPGMIAELHQLSLFAPEHLPQAIALIEACHRFMPGVVQVACFDTAFHHAMPRVATQLPLPRRYESQGIRRYGFHGLSCAYLMQELERLDAANGRVILAHLGNGASMTAVQDGRSVDTSMGFTPAAGLMMSTRSGDIDPGLVAFLMRKGRMTITQFDQMINHQSGLLGVSGISSDMRDLLAREKDDSRAAEAIELFCYQAKKMLGAYAAVLGGLDALVFSGGMGENSAVIRERICQGLDFLGIELDKSLNGVHANIISTCDSRVVVRVIQTNEEKIMAAFVCEIIRPAK